MSPDRSFAVADVARLVARWAVGATWRIEPATDGISTPVYRLSRDHDVRYLRLAEALGERRIAEKRVHDLLGAAGVRVPGVVWFDPSAPEVGRSAMITTAVPGLPLSETIDASAARAIVSCAGRDLASINAIPVRGYGWVIGIDASGALLAEHSDRTIWTAEYRVAAEDVVARHALDGPLLSQRIAEWVALPNRTGSRLAHGDLDASHIICKDRTYSGIIDFGEIRGADRAYDLGHFLLHDGERLSFSLLPALLDGYLAAAPDEAITAREIALQAVAIGTRALARALHDPGSSYAAFLTNRLTTLFTFC